jgi:bifunctional UDP-N-acetylglucosamine pyrophosphorylase / glucosamine-1-phosphate N-acetyltransferase
MRQSLRTRLKGHSLPSKASPRSLTAVLLAAGKGKRMKSPRPKVMHDVCGRPGLWYVARAALGARAQRLLFVVGHLGDEVEVVVRSWGLKPEPVFVDQGNPLGTGHAVTVAESEIGDVDEVLVLAGDDPLVTAEHVRRLLRVHRRTGAAATILTTSLANPMGYGRVIREGDRLVEIVEESDATASIRSISEVSTLVYAFRREDLFKALPRVGKENRQGEYYLPDVLGILREKGERISAVPVDLGGTMGLNSRGGMAAVNRVMRARIVERHLANGVTFTDPDTAYVADQVRIGPDTVIQPMTVLEGDTRIGAGCTIGPASRLVDSVVADEAEVTFSVVRGARIGPRAQVGPYASLRPGTVVEEGAKAGTFVELKKTRVGKGSKVPHLSYVGDATIGRSVNIGAGTITCNYDGFEKFETVIGDEAFIGSDTMLVAPVRIGKRAWTGAGSSIAKDVPDGALAVERAEQRNVRGYDARKRAAHGGRAPGSSSKQGAGGRGAARKKSSRKGGRAGG